MRERLDQLIEQYADASRKLGGYLAKAGDATWKQPAGGVFTSAMSAAQENARLAKKQLDEYLNKLSLSAAKPAESVGERYRRWHAEG